MAADNNLERFAIKNIKALQETGSTDEINFIALFDRSPGYDKTEGNWTDTKLFYISRTPEYFNDDALLDYGELDMTDSNNLYGFLKFVNEYFPAEHTVLNIWSHGRGVYPDCIIPSARSVIEDYTTGYGASYTMSLFDLHSAVKRYIDETQKDIDIVQFDACDMQMIETCYELKDTCEYIVGAETEIPGSGSDYYTIAKWLVNNPETSPKELSTYLCDSFYNYYKDSGNDFSYSVVETKQLENFLNNFNDLCTEILNLNDSDIKKIINKRKNLHVVVPSYPEFMDLNEFLISSELVNLSSIEEYLNKLVILKKESGTYENLGGISINYPYTESLKNYYVKENSNYGTYSFYIDSLWDEVLNKFWIDIEE